MTYDDGAVVVPVLDGQLVLELGDAFAPPAPRFDVVVVVCHLCSGHHPVERCPQRRGICTVCSGAHDATVHLSGVLPIAAPAGTERPIRPESVEVAV